MWKLKFNLKVYLSSAALPGQNTKTAQKAETRTPKWYLMQDLVFRLEFWQEKLGSNQNTHIKCIHIFPSSFTFELFNSLLEKIKILLSLVNKNQCFNILLFSVITTGGD